MRKLVILFAAVLGAMVGYSQSGPEVLGALSQKMAAMGAYRIDFELEMPSATATSSGECVVSDERYVISIEGMAQGFDGSVVWAVNPVNQEITLDAPRPQSRSLFDNPTKAFDFAEELFAVESAQMQEDGVWRLSLLPQKGVLDGIERVEVWVDGKSNLPTRLGYDMAGVGLAINIRSIVPVEPSDKEFEVPSVEGFEVIDFR